MGQHILLFMATGICRWNSGCEGDGYPVSTNKDQEKAGVREREHAKLLALVEGRVSSQGLLEPLAQ